MKCPRTCLALLASTAFAAHASGLAQSCSEIQALNDAADDGLYIVAPSGTPVLVQCDDMGGVPRESFAGALADGVIGKESCKQDGYRLFGIFKTQGDCVSFFASKGRNFPDG